MNNKADELLNTQKGFYYSRLPFMIGFNHEVSDMKLLVKLFRRTVCTIYSRLRVFIKFNPNKAVNLKWTIFASKNSILYVFNDLIFVHEQSYINFSALLFNNNIKRIDHPTLTTYSRANDEWLYDIFYINESVIKYELNLREIQTKLSVHCRFPSEVMYDVSTLTCFAVNDFLTFLKYINVYHFVDHDDIINHIGSRMVRYDMENAFTEHELKNVFASNDCFLVLNILADDELSVRLEDRPIVTKQCIDPNIVSSISTSDSEDSKRKRPIENPESPSFINVHRTTHLDMETNQIVPISQLLIRKVNEINLPKEYHNSIPGFKPVYTHLYMHDDKRRRIINDENDNIDIDRFINRYRPYSLQKDLQVQNIWDMMTEIVDDLNEHQNVYNISFFNYWFKIYYSKQTGGPWVEDPVNLTTHLHGCKLLWIMNQFMAVVPKKKDTFIVREKIVIQDSTSWGKYVTPDTYVKMTITQKTFQKLKLELKPFKFFVSVKRPSMIVSLHMVEQEKERGDSTWKNNYKSEFIQKDIFSIWTDYNERKTFFDIVYDPRSLVNIQSRLGFDSLNEFNGFRIDFNKVFSQHDFYLQELACGADWAFHAKASHRLIRFHLTDVLTNVKENDPENKNDLINWVLNFFAHLLQFPHEKTGTILVIYGREGCGKSQFIFNFIETVFGPEYVVKYDGRHPITSNFANENEDRAIFSVYEEVKTNDPKFLEIIKARSTETKSIIEKKYEDKNVKKCYKNYIFTTNRTIPFNLSDTGNRRFLMLHASDKFIGDKAYFDTLHAAFWANGSEGVKLFVRELLMRDLSNFCVGSPPRTPFLENIIRHAMKISQQWWRECLITGKNFYLQRNNLEFDKNNIDWVLSVCLNDFVSEVKQYALRMKWCKNINKITAEKIYKNLKPVIRAFSDIKTYNLSFARQIIIIPTLELCRYKWNQHFSQSTNLLDEGTTSDFISDFIMV